MASKKYRFVSPGVQLRELDRSQIPDEPLADGPVIIGRSIRGPALKPVRVQDFTEFVEIFGNPQPGNGGGDVWRDGGEGLAPTYGAYAAQAWLQNSSPLTFVRLLGKANTQAGATQALGAAGWIVGGNSTTALGGSYGLFILDSGSIANQQSITGTLAAVIYTEAGYAPVLSGTKGATESTKTSGSAVMIYNLAGAAGNPTFHLQIVKESDNSVVASKEIDFDQTGGKFIRKVLNTNPATLKNRLYASGSQYNYFLGESYESTVTANLNSGSEAGSCLGVILGLNNGTTDLGYGQNLDSASPSSTGWFISYDLGAASSFQPENEADAPNLFKIVSLEEGTWAQKNLKISIQDIQYSDDPADPYGTFSLVIRNVRDSDAILQVVESYANLNLNPDSPNYIGARIGDQTATWDDTQRRYRYSGKYPNMSKYIRVFMNASVENKGIETSALPFGYKGPLRFSGFSIPAASTNDKPNVLAEATTENANSIAFGGPGNLSEANNPTYLVTGMENSGPLLSASFTFPSTTLRANTKTGNLASPTDAYFGVKTTQASNLRFNNAYKDLVRGLPGGQHTADGPVLDPDATYTNNTEYSYIFTLDYITRHSGTTNITQTTNDVDSIEAYYLSGSRHTGVSLSSTGSNTYKDVIDAEFNQFTAPMFGGFDGTDILETNPFNNYSLSGKTETTSYEFNSIKMAMDSCADAELVEMNMMSMPGLTHTGLTDHMLDLAERRSDTLAIIDIGGGYIPEADRGNVGTDSEAANRGEAQSAARTFRTRQVNNSYGAAYYPWTRVRDSQTGQTFYCPPSVAAIGTLSYSQAVSEVWFAPAGFNRGGLTAGSAGIPVVGVTEKLTSKDRDRLYEVNINPIASFPAEGLVIFGQKTLQSTRSALDRINVRRLMIRIKKEISRISNALLFDPNTEVTWDRFKGQVVPFLDSVKSRLGLEDYKVILDKTTTTPDLIDRNIMYAKIFLKPTRAIEFIAVDFIITNTGASFED